MYDCDDRYIAINAACLGVLQLAEADVLGHKNAEIISDTAQVAHIERMLAATRSTRDRVVDPHLARAELEQRRLGRRLVGLHEGRGSREAAPARLPGKRARAVLGRKSRRRRGVGDAAPAPLPLPQGCDEIGHSRSTRDTRVHAR